MTAPDPARVQTDEPALFDASADLPASGPFVWHDLMSAEPARSVAFYEALFGWTTEARHVGSAGSYTYIQAGAHPFGGVVPLDPRFGVPAHWVSYVCVDDVDGTCARAAAAGGKTCIPPTDIPNVGRFAMIEDPFGAVLAPISLPERPGVAADVPPPPGTAWWHELASPDPIRAAAFYRAVFGWRVQEAAFLDGSVYWLFLRRGTPTAGMLHAPPGASSRPHWRVYVAVDDVDATVARAIALGASPSFPCREVPGVGRVGGFVDPTGAVLAVGQSRDGVMGDA
ncbi:Glyoxalase-like domain protein [Gemmatirosa kalamazoonensis]|uniref:Glyoxalase-like domain protein n=1 Tax=Gemmatirosa kalamazoonensis TaxID=861299 RepID=W0REC6_9BACT|nr:VOC family protein [Gemmatirosa kalamazoonensis]AHG88787.1 Glyoxalase-like domain protein [Gemmatirosa kalamazoonensis]